MFVFVKDLVQVLFIITWEHIKMKIAKMNFFLPFINILTHVAPCSVV